MKLSTPTREEAFQVVMKELGKARRETRELSRTLSKGEDAVYSRTSDASEFLKDLVDDDQIPISRKGRYLIRTDLKHLRGEIEA